MRDGCGRQIIAMGVLVMVGPMTISVLVMCE